MDTSPWVSTYWTVFARTDQNKLSFKSCHSGNNFRTHWMDLRNIFHEHEPLTISKMTEVAAVCC